MTAKDIEKSIAICGLVCGLCSYNTGCPGCRRKNGDCSAKKCCSEKGLQFCFECDEYPCEEGMHVGIRSRAFNSVAKTEGVSQLAEYLYHNHLNDIYYHKVDDTSGDYDLCKTEQEVIDLLKNGIK